MRAIGSLCSARAHLPARPLAWVAMQMLCGGAMLGVVAIPTGEVSRFHLAAVTPESAATPGDSSEDACSDRWRMVHSELDALDVAILCEVKRSTELPRDGPAPDAGTAR